MPSTPLSSRSIGLVNWLGLWTLYVREVRRFAKVFTQTILAPVVTTLLFLSIFTLALGPSSQMVPGLAYAQFLAPGLIMAAVMQNAFANTSSSLFISKIQGNIVDVLMPPLSAAELTLGYAAGGASRGLVVAVATGTALAAFVPVGVHDLGYALFHVTAGAVMLSLLGLAAGVWASKFDHIAAVTNFVVTPLAFLSGTFYSIERLPEAWRAVARANPVFYLIDGLRYGMTGHADGSLALGLVSDVAAVALLVALCHRMFASGYRLKS